MAPNDVVGIDASLTATGIAYFDGTLTIGGSKGDDRLTSIRDAVYDICDGARLAVVEDLPVHGHGAGKTGMAQGVVRLTLLDLCVEYVLVPAATLKVYATGRGNASKPDMRVELFKRTGLDLPDDNQVDAYWLRALGLDHLGRPEVDLPASHRRAFDKLAWPLRDGAA